MGLKEIIYLIVLGLLILTGLWIFQKMETIVGSIIFWLVVISFVVCVVVVIKDKIAG